MTFWKDINVAAPVIFLLECNDSLCEAEVSCVMVAVFYFLSVTLVFYLSFRRA